MSIDDAASLALHAARVPPSYRPPNTVVAALRTRTRALAAALRARPDRSRERFAGLAERLEALAIADADDQQWCDAVDGYVTTHDAWDLAVDASAYRNLASDWADVADALATQLAALARARTAESDDGRRLVLELLAAGRERVPRAPLASLPRLGPYGAGET